LRPVRDRNRAAGGGIHGRRQAAGCPPSHRPRWPSTGVRMSSIVGCNRDIWRLICGTTSSSAPARPGACWRPG
jgi:hypothetical protein